MVQDRARWLAVPLAGLLVLWVARQDSWHWGTDHWRWLGGILGLGVVFFVTATGDPRRHAEVKQWDKWQRRRERRVRGAGAKPKTISTLPGDFVQVASDCGDGVPVACYELIPKSAYVAFVDANGAGTSDYQSVVMKLAAPGPNLTVNPLPIVDGARVPNTGIKFKDAEFAEQFYVEGTQAVEVKKWLIGPLREALLGLPDAWLRVRGRTMALTLYGRIEAEQIEELVATADVLFAEYGADGGPSLFIDEADSRDERDEEEAADGPDEAEGDEPTAASAPKAEKGAAAKPKSKKKKKKTKQPA